RAIDEPLAVRGHRREAVVVRAARQLAEPAAVRSNHGDLRAVLDAIAGLQEQAVESVEERVEHADAEDDRVTARRPLRREDIAGLVLIDDGLGVRPGSRYRHAGAECVLRRTDR